jgi:hypothetical protein
MRHRPSRSRRARIATPVGGRWQDAETTKRRTEARALPMITQPVHIHTYTGIAFDLRNPRPEMVCLDDIVHSLSLMNRFNGVALFPYSVAQHSLHVAELLPPALGYWVLVPLGRIEHSNSLRSDHTRPVPSPSGCMCNCACSFDRILRFGRRIPAPQIRSAMLAAPSLSFSP